MRTPRPAAAPQRVVAARPSLPDGSHTTRRAWPTVQVNNSDVVRQCDVTSWLPPRHVPWWVGLLSAAALAVTACGGGGGASAERFCGEVDEHRELLTDPIVEFEGDIEPLLELYRGIGDVAPLSIEREWRRLITAYETASTVVPGDAESEQIALAEIYSSEESAARVSTWLKENCAVDIGPVFTIVPHDG